MVCGSEEILLGYKKRGFGEGRWNGFGGKVEEGETIESAAKRELREESGIEAVAMQEVGVLDFSFQNDPKILEVHIFKVTEFTGAPAESEEMRPQWFAFDKIPFDGMWSDDIYWVPLLLSGKLFKGAFLFDKPSSLDCSAKIVSQELREVAAL
jgi:8-oxo-dGTP diphosphatase/2-hydroxy-dATP diphosphatase